MKWLDFPPIAEFPDRHGVIRSIRGCTVFGQFEFADRFAAIQEILDDADPLVPWTEIYRQSSRFRHSIEGALSCWGIDPDWLSESQIEQMLFRREGDKQGWLLELAMANARSTPNPSQEGRLEQAIAAIATHCNGVMEALDLADKVPAQMLTGILKARTTASDNPAEDGRKQDLKRNFNEIMAKFEV